MMLISGVDLIEIERLRDAVDRQGERFLNRVFTLKELEENARKMESLAARFAAKEAVAKAFGCGIGEISWKDVEILRSDQGAPILILHNIARQKADALGITEWSISLSHTHTLAIAMVVGLGGQ